MEYKMSLVGCLISLHGSMLYLFACTALFKLQIRKHQHHIKQV